MSAATEEKIAYSISEAAQMVGVSQSTIRRAIDEGYLVAKKPKGLNRPLIRAEALSDWLDGDT